MEIDSKQSNLMDLLQVTTLGVFDIHTLQASLLSVSPPACTFCSVINLYFLPQKCYGYWLHKLTCAPLHRGLYRE